MHGDGHTGEPHVKSMGMAKDVIAVTDVCCIAAIRNVVLMNRRVGWIEAVNGNGGTMRREMIFQVQKVKWSSSLMRKTPQFVVNVTCTAVSKGKSSAS